MRGKEASSDTSAEELRLPGAGLGTPPLRSRRFPAGTRARAAKPRRRPRRFPRVLRVPLGFGGREGGRSPGEVLGAGGTGSGSRSRRRAGAPGLAQTGLGLISFWCGGDRRRPLSRRSVPGNHFPGLETGIAIRICLGGILKIIFVFSPPSSPLPPRKNNWGKLAACLSRAGPGLRADQPGACRGNGPVVRPRPCPGRAPSGRN